MKIVRTTFFAPVILFASLIVFHGAGAQVSSFNTRTGAVTLNDLDVTQAVTPTTAGAVGNGVPSTAQGINNIWGNAGNFPLVYDSARAGWVINVADFGAICDGTSHKLNSRFSTIGDAQAVYGLPPYGVSVLTEEIDAAAINYALNVARTTPGGVTSGALAFTRIAVRHHRYQPAPR